MEKAVTSAPKLFEDLQATTMKSPIIFPRDFTSDWAEEKRKMKRRHSHKEFDDDEFEMAIEEEERRLREEPRNEGQEQEQLSENETTPADQVGGGANPEADMPENKVKAEKMQAPLNILQDLKSAPEHLKDLQNTTEADPSSVEDMNHAIQNLTNPPGAGDNSSPPLQEQDPRSQDIIKDDPASPHDQIPVDKHDGSPSNSEKQEAYDQGLEAGRREALREFEESTKSLSSTLSAGISELEKLKKTILQSSQENFKEIAAAISEALVNKSLDLNPTIFKGIVERAVSDGIPDEQFSVKLSPTDMERLKQVHSEGLPDSWNVDGSLAPGSFEIESQDSKISSSIHEIVNNMISELDSDMFETTAPSDSEPAPHSEMNTDENQSDDDDQSKE